jgi:hypothetical protein
MLIFSVFVPGLAINSSFGKFPHDDKAHTRAKDVITFVHPPDFLLLFDFTFSGERLRFDILIYFTK